MAKPVPIAPRVNYTRNMYSTAVTSVSDSWTIALVVTANNPMMALAAKLPGTMGIQPTGTSCEMSLYLRKRVQRLPP